MENVNIIYVVRLIFFIYIFNYRILVYNILLMDFSEHFQSFFFSKKNNFVLKTSVLALRRLFFSIYLLNDFLHLFFTFSNNLLIISYMSSSLSALSFLSSLFPLLLLLFLLFLITLLISFPQIGAFNCSHTGLICPWSIHLHIFCHNLDHCYCPKGNISLGPLYPNCCLLSKEVLPPVEYPRPSVEPFNEIFNLG